ncbi:unnamed protein product [Rotaria socialis]
MESSLNQIILNQIIRTLIIDNETQQITYIIDQRLQHLRRLQHLQHLRHRQRLQHLQHLQHLRHLRHLNRIQAPQRSLSMCWIFSGLCECCWNHWILDALICNGGGIYLSMKAREYLKMKPYNWRGMWTIPTVRGKMMRVFWSIYAS